MERTRHLRASIALLGAALIAHGCSAAPAPGAFAFDGPEDEALNAERLEQAVFEARAEDDRADVEDLVVLLDADDVTEDAEREPGRLAYAPGELDDGDWTVAIAQPAGDGEEPSVLHQWQFTVDTVPPELELVSPDGAVIAGEEVTVAGATEPGALVAVGSEQGVADADGAFEVVLDEAPEGSIALTATDPAGNVTSDELTLVSVPSRVETEEVRSVHVSFCAWATPSLREPVLAMIDDGLINAVQLDLKDETGKIGHATDVDIAHLVGADSPDCDVDLPAAVSELHERGVPVIGRIVAFADPVLARWAWDNDHRDWVTQTAEGEMFVGKYAGFSNFADPDMVEYNIAVAEEAAAAGVDHILWDYLRKPDGPFEQFHFAGLETSAEDSLVEFVAEADERLAPYGVQHGASLYGVSADRPTEVAQDVERMAEHLDYVAPMIYPSHWGSGEYDVADPLHQPYDMVAATLEVWSEATDGKRARVMPWLEDSNWPVRLGYPDRAGYVREQIEATYDAGIDEWLLWDSAVSYTTAAMVQPPED